MVTLIKEDGTGKTDANSYADYEECVAYHEANYHVGAWEAVLAEDAAACLVMATRVIDAEYQFNGARAVAGQALQWPRTDCPDPDGGEEAVMASDAVPAAVVRACCEMARELYLNDRTAAPPGEGIAQQHNSDMSATVYSKSDTRPIISHLTQAMLGKYGRLYREGGRGGMVRLVRV